MTSSGRESAIRPIPQLVEGGVGTWPAPLTSGLHGVLKDVTDALEGRSEADPAAVTFQLLSGFANIVGQRHYAQVDEDRHYGRLWVALIGSTGAGKGLSFGVVRSLLAEVDPEWASKRIGSGVASGEALVEAVRDADPEHDDPGADDSRLLIVEAELATLFRVCRREGNTLSPTLRKFWDSGDEQIRRAKRTVIATGAHVSICAHITATELRREVSSIDIANGVVNRYLLVLCRRQGNRPDGGRMDRKDHAQIVSQLREAVDWSKHGRAAEIARDSEARDLWHEVYPSLVDRPENAFGFATSRARAQVLRLSLILAVLDQSMKVTRVHLEAALDLWRYCEESAAILFGEGQADQTSDRILEAIRSAGDAGLSRSGLNRSLHGHVKAAELDELIGDLIAQGIVVEVEEPGIKNRKRTAYLLRDADLSGLRNRSAA